MTASAPAGTAPGLVSDRRLNLIALALVVGAITTFLDTTIVNVALDRLGAAFGTAVTQTQWVATGYLLAFVAVIPVSGWVSERFGSRNAWMAAIGVFLIASALCGLAWDLPSLIAFRVLQGVGGGMVLPIALSILARAAGPRRMTRAMISIGTPGQLASILGPVIGGSIVQGLDWHWLFLVNVPICLAALVLAPILLPAAAGRRGHALDALGFVLLTPALVALADGVSQATGEDGFGAAQAWLPIAIGAVLLDAFVWHALTTRRDTLIDVRVFARRSFGISSLITFVGGFSMFALMFLLPLFYQRLRGESVLGTGLLLIPQGLGTVLFLIAGRRFLDRVDGRLVVAGGVLLTMLGIVPFALAGSHGGTWLLLAAQFVQGIGLAASSMPVMALAIAGLGHDETPRGTAAFSIVQRVGAPFGVAVIAVVLESLLAGGADPVAAFQQTFWWILALSAIPLVLAWLIPRRKAGQG